MEGRHHRTELRNQLRRYLHAAYIDFRLFVTGKREERLPPLRLRDVGARDFRVVGDQMVAFLVSNGFQRGDRVLDIGCGVGRVAIPLTRYSTLLRPRRRRPVAPLVPPEDPQSASELSFHPRRCLQLALQPPGVAASSTAFRMARFVRFRVRNIPLTHLDLEAARNYVRDAHRVLRPGGTLLATFFLFESAPEGAALDFKVDHGAYRLLDESDPDWAIAFGERMVGDFLPPSEWAERKLAHGTWRNEAGLGFQDVVVARRR